VESGKWLNAVLFGRKKFEKSDAFEKARPLWE
jgi:hypothetical protein